MSSSPVALFPSLPAIRRPDGRIVLTGKFLSGIQAWADRLESISVVFRPASTETDNLDNEAIDPSEVPFPIRVAELDSPEALEVLAGAKAAVGMLGVQQNHLPFEAKRRNVPFISTSEYSLRTRLQIAAAEESSPYRRAKRQVWECKQEVMNLRAVRASVALQANGTPTYDAYRWVASDTLLFFDTRVTADMVIRSESLERRLAEMEQGGPLRLGFSGRLNEMKGADHLVKVAEGLARQGVDFRLSIAGDGALRAELERQVESLGLKERVKLLGNLDFQTELVPWVEREVDLFVMCHRQGDPSCTYFETMAGGVPIVGYDNEAFAGILRRYGVGRSAPMDHPAELARAIGELAGKREQIASWSRNARRVAASQTFEATMDARAEQVNQVAARAAA